jgi:MFS family permease
MDAFISLRVALENFEAMTAGLVLSSYFFGSTVGAMCCGRVVERIGHIASKPLSPAWSLPRAR